MRLLIIGSDKVYAIENFYVKYIRESDTNTKVFQFLAQSIFYDFYQKNIFNKILYKSGMSKINKIINNQFREAVNECKPDIIWVFKGMEISPESLQWAKQKGIKMVNYNPDNPFVFSGKGSGNSNVKESILLYDMHLTYNLEVKREMETVYKIPTEILPFGYDISEDLLSKCRLQKEINKVCFLGNPDKFRGEFLQQLAATGIKLDVYGNKWQNFVNHSNITIFDPVYGADFWLTLYKYRVQLNLMRPHNPESHNMRSFEVPGVGGIQLATDTPDHRTFFNPNKEIFLYSNLSECASQILFLQSLPLAGAEEIRTNARKKSIQSGYSYKDRAAQALSFIDKIL